jgi:hypothetical protein
MKKKPSEHIALAWPLEPDGSLQPWIEKDGEVLEPTEDAMREMGAIIEDTLRKYPKHEMEALPVASFARSQSMGQLTHRLTVRLHGVPAANTPRKWAVALTVEGPETAPPAP